MPHCTDLLIELCAGDLVLHLAGPLNHQGCGENHHKLVCVDFRNRPGGAFGLVIQHEDVAQHFHLQQETQTNKKQLSPHTCTWVGHARRQPANSHFNHSNIHHPPTHPVIQSVSQSLSQSVSHSLARSLTHSLAHSITHSLTHSLTHSSTHSTSTHLCLGQDKTEAAEDVEQHVFRNEGIADA